MKRIFVAILGQSNEAGHGTTPSTTRSYGAPTIDPVPPNGAAGTRSMWPLTAELMGKRGVMARFYNTAVGATSILNSWVGCIRTWVTGMSVCAGSYVLNGGNVYKMTSAESGNTYVTGSTAPTGTGTTTDGTITWTYVAAARAQDVNGYVYPSSDALFDPNGHMANIVSGLSGATGFSEKWVYISIGQTDFTCFTAGGNNAQTAAMAAQYQTGIQNATNYFLANGAKVMIGFTVYGAATNMDAAFTSQSSVIAASPPTTNAQVAAIAAGEATNTLCYGWWQALQSFSANANVFQGANLRYVLGLLPTAPTQIGVAGVQSGVNNVHMNDSAYEWASVAVSNAFAAAGR